MYGTEDKILLCTLERDIYPVLPDSIIAHLKLLGARVLWDLEEIRIRAERPLMLQKRGQDYFINLDGSITSIAKQSLIIKADEVNKALQLMSNYSIYAIEEELKQGFLTLRGGHRVGFVGRSVNEEGKIKTIKNISGLNIRIAREVKGCAMTVIKEIYREGLKHTLVVSPPGCGKTTLLRDMIRILSTGSNEAAMRGYKVGVVDERSEIAGCYLGIPQRDVGVRTDVLDACPKVQGIGMLLRSMSPEVIAVDEIGSEDDAKAIEDAINSGVKVIATIHGSDMEEVYKKNGIKKLIERNLIEKIVILNRKNGPGTIDKIINI